MSKLSRSKIAYDLNVSPHKFTMIYESEEITYIFSSKLYKDKFIEKLVKNRENINISLSNRFGFKISVDMIADLKLYITTEKRGFLLLRGEDKIEWLEHIILDGMIKIKKI